MARTENVVVINAPLELVWIMTNDVTSWPQLFSEYASAEVLAVDGATVRFRLTLHPDEDGKTWSWVSERTPDPVTRTVQARRIETGPFEYMNINWSYRPVDGGVEMRWVQDFTVRPGLPFDDSAMENRLNTNTRREMARIKALVEEAAESGDGGDGATVTGDALRVLLRIEVQPGREDEFERVWRQHAEFVRGLADNRGQALYRDRAAGNAYVVETDWADEGAFRAFERSEPQQEYLRRLWPMRAGGSMALLTRLVALAAEPAPEPR
jgi:heme-degrading monooxygenase HmoA